MPLLLYTLTALALLGVLQRFVCRFSRPAAALLFFLPFLFVGPALVTSRVYAPIDKAYGEEPFRSARDRYGIGDGRNPVTMDIFSQMIPWRHAVRESYARGEWALWNPAILCGDVLAAAAQPAAYSPFTLIALLMPAPVSFTFTAAIAFFLAAAGTFAFARELGCRESAAAIAAAGYTCSTAIALYVLWPLGFSWSLLPFVLIGTHRVATAPSVRAWGLLTTAFTLLLLAGHGESALHVVAVGAVYGLVVLRRPLVRAIAAAAAAGVVALLVSAIHLLPHLDVLPQSAEYLIRWSWRGSVTYDETPQMLANLATNFFPFLHVRRWLDPALPGVKAESAAVGSLVLALAAYAVFRARSRATWFFLGVAVVGIAAQSSWKGINAIFARIPLFDVTLNERLAFAAAFALSILAALGAERLARRDDRAAATVVFAALLVLLGLATWWLARAFTIAPGPVDWGRFKIAGELVLLAVAIAALRLPARWLLPALMVLILVQRTLAMSGVHASFPQRAAYPPLPLFEPLRRARAPFRVAGTAGALTPNTAALYALEDVRGYEAMTFSPYFETYRLWCEHQPVFFNRIDDLSKPFLSMVNVRFAFADASTPVPPGWRLVKQDGDAVLLANDHAFERAFVPPEVTMVRGRSDAINEMQLGVDLRKRAWIEADVSPYSRVNGPGRVAIVRAGAGGYDLDADMQGDGWIVVTSTNWRGWRAYIDGRRVETQPANSAFIGIYTPRGKHRVRLVYWPEAFVVGRAVTFATLAALVLFAVARRRIYDARS